MNRKTTHIKGSKKPGIKTIEFSEIKGLVTGSDTVEKPYFYQPLMPFRMQFFEPYRTRFYGIGLVHTGNITLYTDLLQNNITSYSLIVMGPDVVRQWADPGSHFQLEALFFAESFRHYKQLPVLSFDGFDFFDCHGQHVFPLTDTMFKHVSLLFKAIASRVAMSKSYEDVFMHHTIALLITEIKALYKELSPSPTTRINPLVNRFKKMVTQHFREQHTVAYYANKLHINARHLSQTIKKETGKTASEWIQELLVLEAKILLQEKASPISQIADTLHFADQSMFGKFFKKYTGLNPSQYRQQLTN